MSDKIKSIKKLLKEEKDTNKVILELVNIIDDLNKRCEALEDEIDGMSEEIGLISQGMHIEDYNPIVEAVCPYCQKEIEINLETLDNEDEFVCPNCKKEITLEWDEECDCGCDHDDCDCGDDCDCDDK